MHFLRITIISTTIITFNFKTFANVWKSCKNSTKNFHKSLNFTYSQQLLTFYDIWFPPLSIFLLNSDDKVQISSPFLLNASASVS